MHQLIVLCKMYVKYLQVVPILFLLTFANVIHLMDFCLCQNGAMKYNFIYYLINFFFYMKMNFHEIV